VLAEYESGKGKIMQLTYEQRCAFRDHVVAEYPNEAVAILHGGQLIPLENVSDTPREAFKVDPHVYLRYSEGLEAVLHSHTHELEKFMNQDIDLRTPSARDMQGQRDTNVPWGIVSTEGEDISEPVWLGVAPAPLRGRHFVHGIWDCYSIVRDYYLMERDITLPDYPRNINWWGSDGQGIDENFYMDKYAEAGFEVVTDHSTVKKDDVVLMQIRAEVTNHAAVYLGDNKILHHCFGMLSCEDNYNRWGKYVTLIVRYKGTK